MNARRNVVLITTDQQPWHAMSGFGNQHLSTPGMDALLERGVLFERAYASDPVCTPQRASWLTGRYSSENGAPFNGGSLHPGTPSLGTVLRQAGYETFHAGKWHVPGADITDSFVDLYSGARPIDASGGEIYDVAITDSACEFLADRRATDPPFFLQVHLVNPHDICEYLHNFEAGDPKSLVELGVLSEADLPPLPDNFGYDPTETVLQIASRRVDGCLIHDATRRALSKWTDLQWREYIWHFYRFVEQVDRQISRILSALDRADAGETVIIFTADHGEGLGSHQMFQKFTLYDESVRVPLVLVDPSGKAGTRESSVVSTISVFATICDIAGAVVPEGTRGHSLLHTARDEWAELAYIECNYFGRAVVTERYKYITEYIPSGSDSHPPNRRRNSRGREQLFAVDRDPGELSNLAHLDELISVLELNRSLLATLEDSLEQPELDHPLARETAAHWSEGVRRVWAEIETMAIGDDKVPDSAPPSSGDRRKEIDNKHD